MADERKALSQVIRELQQKRSGTMAEIAAVIGEGFKDFDRRLSALEPARPAQVAVPDEPGARTASGGD
jgi:hypothetical protein